MNGLPGIEVLFREHKRLANKLTKDELKSLKTYINGRLMQENEELLFEFNELKSSHNASIYEHKEQIEALQKELQFKNEIIKNYKSSEENLSSVYKKRGERLERRHSVLLEDHEANRETVKLFEMRIRNMQTELEEYQKKVLEQSRILDEREQAIKRLKESQDNVVNSEKLAKDLLKVKLAVDEKEREYQKVKKQNEELSQQIEMYKTKLLDFQQKIDKIQGDFDNQTIEYRSKCEKLAALHYQMDLEKRKTSDLQKELENLQNIAGISPNTYPDQGSREHHGNREAPNYRAESMRSQVQYLEGRVKLLEERLALYRTSVRDSTKEIGIIDNDSKRLEQMLERIVIQESTAMETPLVELRESIETRRCILEESVDEILRQIPAVISKEAVEIRAAVISLKRQSEIGRVGDVTIRCTRLLPRIEACEKAQFGNYEKIVNRNWKEGSAAPKYFTKHRRSIDITFSGLPLPKKPPSVPLLLRSKTQNGTLPLNKRKYSVSMDSVVVSPTVFDLSVGPGPPPSPRMKDSQPKASFGQLGRPLSAFSNQPIVKASR